MSHSTPARQWFHHLAQTFEITRIMDKMMNTIVLRLQAQFPFFQHVHLSDAQPVLLCNGWSNIGVQVQYLSEQALTKWAPAT